MLFSEINIKALFLTVLGCFASSIENADAKVQETTEVRSTDDQSSLRVGSKTQVVCGLKVMRAEPFEHLTEFTAIGKVINIQPLLALRERYLVSLAELGSAKARQKQSGQSLKRQQALFRFGIAAKRSLQEQEALGYGDQALVDAGQVRVSTIVNEARLEWGNPLAEWLLAKQPKNLAAFLSGQQQLVQVTLPTGKQLGMGIDTIFIDSSGQRAKAYAATLISRSTQIDNSQQGESYFFRANGANLRAGMKVNAWIPEGESQKLGVIVPESALVWYMDQVYIYLKTGKDIFNRRLIKNFTPVGGGYFLQEGVQAGEEIVMIGAQTLLSEELRGQIPDD
jgi:hypothetical protein